MAKRFVVGDLHGNYKGFMQALERSGFNYITDLLISIGDIADGYSEVPQIIEEVMKMSNFIWILGNHDKWVQEWYAGQYNMTFAGMKGEYDHPLIPMDVYNWLSQGGKATYAAYMRHPELISKHEKFWLEKPILYTALDHKHTDIDDDLPYGGKCFVHGGFNKDHSIIYQSRKTPHVLYWDRNLWNKALSTKSGNLSTADKFDEIFIGHTSTNFWGTMHPMNSGGIWNVDTGAGWHGKVTIMDIDTKKYWQSDLATELYPNEKPRK